MLSNVVIVVEVARRERQKIEQVIGYLSDNVAGLRDYRLDAGAESQHLGRTGAIESPSAEGWISRNQCVSLHHL